MLLVLLLTVSVLAIGAAAVAPAIARQIRRDQEEELIHRGMEYRRAIRSFAKRTGNFPVSLDQLEGTNGTRYLRRRYKDPITGGEFRLLHMNDIAASRTGPNTTNPQGGNTNAAATGFLSATSSVPSSGAATADQNVQPSQPADSGGGALQSAVSSNPPIGGAGFGGGVILGVASRSPKKTIREFNNKNHYNQWLFFYSATYDGSVEVKGPTPSTPVFAAQKSSSDSSNLQTAPSPGQAPQAPQ